MKDKNIVYRQAHKQSTAEATDYDCHSYMRATELLNLNTTRATTKRSTTE